MEVKEKRKLSDLTYDQLAAVRVRLDAQIQGADQVVSALKTKREKVNQEFLARFNAQGGIQSVKTPHGTPYVIHRTSCTVADWESYLDWVVERNEWDYLERRANKTMVEAFKEANGGQLPPGLNWSVTAALGFRK